MKKINSTQLMCAYEDARRLSKEESSELKEFRPVELIFEEKKSKPEASIMIYGVYNAGKSTLINALLGKEEALADDIPTTDQISAYQWGQYSILDTPGVDAPIEHEVVTKEQLLKADAVIFVVDPVGTAEEKRTLSVLLDLVEKRKQVFLVFNEKKEISEDDFIKLKDQIRTRLQQMAAERRLHDILKNIPISRINAKWALQGKLKNQARMIEFSGYPSFERQLKKFLQSISSDNVYGRLKAQLLIFLENYVDILNNRSTSEIAKNYDKMLREIGTEKTKLRVRMHRDILRRKSAVYERSKIILHSSLRANNSINSSQEKIQQLLETSSNEIFSTLNGELQDFILRVQDEIEQLQVAIPNIHANQSITPTSQLNDFNDVENTSSEYIEQSSIDWSTLQGTFRQFATLAKPEHIVDSLKIVKSTLPSLMKGIGPKTMEKWASSMVGRWIPYVGPVITAASILHDIFSGDSEEKRLHQHLEDQKQEEERARQQIEDFAASISEDFESSMFNTIQKELDSFFAKVTEQVDSLQRTFSESDRKNSERLEILLEIKQVAANA